MIPTKYKFIIREFKNDYHTSIASKLITPYDWWLNNKVKIFSLQYNFLRPSPYDLRTEENDVNFLPYQIKKSHHVTYHDSLLQENIPKGISDPLPPSQPIASQPLGDCEKSYYYAIAKKGYSNNELLFIISHLTSILTKGNIKEHK